MRILCVDDDPVILELLSEVLRVIGLTNVDYCLSVDEALERIGSVQVPYDCFLFDIQMPDRDGIELVALVRAMPDYIKSPILMITAMSDRTYIDQAFAAGATDYITKPFELGEVHARLRLIETLVLERKQLNDRNPVPIAGRSLSVVSPADMDEMLTLVDIDGFIQFLALENYLLKLSQMSLIGMYAVGVTFPNLERTFQGGSAYEYKSAVTDFAEAISESLKPRKFLGAHAGGESFVFVLEDGGDFQSDDFEILLVDTIEGMELYRSDGRPLSLRPVVGEPISLQMKTSKNVVGSLGLALKNTRMAAADSLELTFSGLSGFCRLQRF
jgi:CheY-like chemotaxis protein